MMKAGRIDPRAARRWQRYIGPFARLMFRPRLDGVERLPREPFLLVANHSGQGNAEIVALIVMWLDRFGTERPLSAMVHTMNFHAWPHGRWMQRLGAIPSTYEAAEATLAAGTPVLVFPGGDHESMRPVWQANEVQFAGRQGFLKIARKMNVPVVPLGIRGSHYTAPIVYRGGALLPRLLLLPRLMGFRKRFPLALLSIVVAAMLAVVAPIWLAAPVAFLFAGSPLASLPWIPWSIRMRIGTPIPARELFPDDDDRHLDTAYHRVEAAVQDLVTPRTARA